MGVLVYRAELLGIVSVHWGRWHPCDRLGAERPRRGEASLAVTGGGGCRAVFQVGEPQDCGEERGASGGAEPGVFMKSEDKDPSLGWV